MPKPTGMVTAAVQNKALLVELLGMAVVKHRVDRVKGILSIFIECDSDSHTRKSKPLESHH